MSRRLKEGESMVRFSFVLPRSLYTRLLKRAAKETGDTETRVSPSEVCRAAIEEYLGLYEGTTFVKAVQSVPPARRAAGANR